MYTSLSDDHELVSRIQSGDRLAFDLLVRKHYSAIRRQVGKLVPIQDVDDVTQDIFTKLVSGIHTFQGRSSFVTWLNGILRHAVADYYRKAYVCQDALPVSDCDLIVEADTASVEMQDYLNRLPKSYREVISLKFVEGLGFVEMASATGLGYERVRSRYRRALKFMRDRYCC